MIAEDMINTINNYLINSKETKQEKPKLENKKEEEKVSILDTYNYKISDNSLTVEPFDFSLG